MSEETNFDCGVCLDKAEEPVVTQCGHLFCWPCLNTWLQRGHNDCPTCKAGCSESNIIPLYGKGKSHKPQSSSEQAPPPRPQATRPPTPPRRQGFPFTGGFGFGIPFFEFHYMNEAQRGPTWDDDTKSKFFLYIGALFLLYLFLL